MSTISTTIDAGPPRPPIQRPAAGPLSAEQLEKLSDANRRAAKVMRACKVASFNGWTCGVIAGASLLFAFSSVVLLVMGVALAVVSFGEIRGKNMLRQFDLRGPRRLGYNQLGLMAVVIAYSLWRIYCALSGPGPYDEYLNSPELIKTVGPIGDLYVFMTLCIYGGVIVLSATVQGLTALYYFTRKSCIQAYLDETPDWVIEVQRSASCS